MNPTDKGGTAVAGTEVGLTLGPNDLGSEDLAEVRAPAIPRRIGRYPVLGPLGEGGMGVVYAAYDEELDRRIAIKLLIRSGGKKNEHNRTRIRREAQAMARLSHPAVAHVYEVGEFEGLTYIAMEYIRGTTLKGWLAEAHPLAERIKVLVQAGRGLVAAHRAGVVHRDFKPDNVMVDRRLRTRVLDFGLAQAHEDDSIEKTGDTFSPPGRLDHLAPDITREGAVMGTPAYMSPEQHLGAPTSATTDQYSFCAVVYEGLYGVRPYGGANRLAIFYAITQGTITAPPADHGVPARIHQVIMRGLAKDPAQRWPSMEALVDALEAAAGTKRRSWLFPVLGLVALVVIAALAVKLMTRPVPTPEQASAVDTLARAAILAGAHARWVYPEPDAPRDTALVWVHEVAALAESEDEAPAVVQSAQDQNELLRANFGAALMRLGDYYWEREGGRVFARDFYLQAALFDSSLTLARERAGFTNGEIADIRARALSGELTSTEIDAGADLAALAAVVPEDPAEEVDEVVVAEKLAKVIHRRRAVREAEPTRVRKHRPPPEPEPEPEPEPVAEPAEVASGSEGGADDAGAEAPEPPVEPVLDRAGARKQAAALVAEGERLRKAGRASRAQNKFFAALRLHERNAKAHDGLRRIKFDAGRYAEAVPHAEKAARDAPSSARFRRTLGDVYFKVGRFTDAETAYARAVAMGDAKAKDRLARVRKKLGK